MRNLSKLAWVVSRGQASADRLDEVLSVDVRVVERRHAIAAPRFAGAVQFRSVSFGYAHDLEVLHRGLELLGGDVANGTDQFDGLG